MSVRFAQHVEGVASAQTESASPGQVLSFGLTAPVGSHWAVAIRGGERNAQNIAVGGGTLANSFNRNWNGMVALGYTGDDLHAGLAYKHYDFGYGLPGAIGDPGLGAQIRGAREELRFRSDRGLGAGWLSYLRLDGTAQPFALVVPSTFQAVPAPRPGPLEPGLGRRSISITAT